MTRSYAPHTSTVCNLNWQAAPQCSGPACAWLADTESLTRKLKIHSQGQFDVQVLDEQRCFTSPGKPLPRGAADPGRLFWQRDVLLLGGGEPWVRACTLVPARYQRLTRRLRLLGNSPLGAFLFSRPELTRMGFDFASLPEGEARRSWFRMGSQQIILIELFLHEFLDTL